MKSIQHKLSFAAFAFVIATAVPGFPGRRHGRGTGATNIRDSHWCTDHESS